MRRAVAFTVAAAFVVAACSSDGGGSVEAFWESTQTLADSPDPFSESGPEDFAAAYEEFSAAVNAMADDAPSEISDDAKTMAEVTEELFDTAGDIDPTDEEAVQEAFAPFFDADADPEFATALGSVNEFALPKCGIDLIQG